jgi:flagella basal body P-ring formation protein FlgA
MRLFSLSFLRVVLGVLVMGTAVMAQNTTANRADRMLVRSGDRITIWVRIGAVQASGVGIASGSGQLGDTIRVLASEGRRALTARITGPGTVEVKQ